MPIPPWLALVLREAPHLAKEYGPAALAWAREHPDMVRDLVAQVRPQPRSADRRGAAEPASDLRDAPDTAASTSAPVEGADGDVGDTIARLREHVAYLLESADDDAERRRAEAWGAKLDRLERAHALVSPGRSATERRTLEAQVDQLRAEVVAAFLVERIEDAGGPSPSDADR